MEILELVDKLESTLSSSARLPMAGRAIVNLEQLLEMVDQLRSAIPDNMKEAQMILQKRDNILNQALMESRRVRAAGEEEASAKVAENQIVKDAQRKAEETLVEAQHRAQRLLGEADKQARARIKGSDQYAREVLQKLEQELDNLLGTVRTGIAALDREVEAVAA